MAQAPEPVSLQTQNFPSEHKPLMDLLVPVLQRQFDQSRACLSGGIGATNLESKLVTFTVNVPASEAWLPCTLGSGWSSTTAVSNGFAPPRYRINGSGQVQLSGGLEHNTAVGAFPVTVLTGMPATQLNEDMTGWIQFWDGAGNRFQGTALLRMDNTGTLTWRAFAAVANGAAGTPNAVEFLSLDNIFYTPLFPNPGVYSVFPITVPIPFSRATEVTVVQIQDTQSSPPATVLGGIDWVLGDFGKLVVRNVTGLVVGRQYNVTVRVWP